MATSTSTSTLAKLAGLPTFIYLKTGTWPNLHQSALGEVEVLGVTGLSLALHFVFGPYILFLHQMIYNQNKPNNIMNVENNKPQETTKRKT
jgi:hypothetical protein